MQRMRQSSLRGGMGVWSLNPNLWGLTQDQATAYEQAQAQAALTAQQVAAQAAVLKAQTDAAVNQANPGILSTFSQTMQGTVKAAGGASSLLLWGAVIGLGVWAYVEVQDSRKTRKAAAQFFSK